MQVFQAEEDSPHHLPNALDALAFGKQIGRGVRALFGVVRNVQVGDGEWQVVCDDVEVLFDDFVPLLFFLGRLEVPVDELDDVLGLALAGDLC